MIRKSFGVINANALPMHMRQNIIYMYIMCVRRRHGRHAFSEGKDERVQRGGFTRKASGCEKLHLDQFFLISGCA